MGRRDAEADLQLPPGFRFVPTEEELIVHYLCRKAALLPLPVPIIADVNLYKYDPWRLPEKALFGEKEWYFFTPRDRKYPNGSRPNRAAGSGYWKANGVDKPITSSAKGGRKRVGVKKALVFFVGKAPSGSKTNWLMHEYRLADINRPARNKGSLRLDDWVLCKIYNRKIGAEKLALKQKQSFNDVLMETIDEKEMKDEPTSTSINHSAIEQSNPSFDHLSKLGSSPTCYNAVPPHASPMNSNICFENLDFFQNSTTPFSGGTLKALVQNTTFNPISSRNCNSTDLMSGLHNHSSCSKPSLFSEPFWEREKVESSFGLENFLQERQQSLVNSDLEGLQNPFPHLGEMDFSDAYQDWILSSWALL